MSKLHRVKRGITIIVDNNPNNFLMDGRPDVEVKRLLPSKPYNVRKKPLKIAHILPNGTTYRK